LDQLGVADEIAWMLFGPLVQREIGSAEEVATRSQSAGQALDAIMARSWIILNRAPTFMPTALLAFHPVRFPDRVIRLHPLACMLMNGDYDGDQAAVFLPLTEEAQREAGERLSIAGHLRRDPELVKWLFPNQVMLWGLAVWSMTVDGRNELTQLLGEAIIAPEGYITRDTMIAALRQVLQREGEEAMLDIAQQLMAKGLETTRQSGASISPFIGESLRFPAAPEGDDLENWTRYVQECDERLASHTDFTDDLGPQLLAVKSGARGNLVSLRRVIGPWGTVKDVRGNPVIVRHGFRDGLTATELFATVPGAREGLQRALQQGTQVIYGVRETGGSKGFTVLARAMRSDHPGLVFAHAAATGEVDPLNDVDSRLFVGMMSEP
jgi:DNA-directed RNA polymerase beta' subunit